MLYGPLKYYLGSRYQGHGHRIGIPEEKSPWKTSYAQSQWIIGRRPVVSIHPFVLCCCLHLSPALPEASPRVGPGHPSSSLVHLLPYLFPFLLFPFFHWLYLFSSFVHPFPLYQNSPTPFSGRRS